MLYLIMAREMAFRPRELLDKYINAEYSARGVGKKFSDPKDERLIKRAAPYIFMAVPAYLRIPDRFGSAETQSLLKEKADWFFEGLKEGRISVFYKKFLTGDMEYSITLFGVTECCVSTDGGPSREPVTIFIDKTVEKVVPGKA